MAAPDVPGLKIRTTIPGNEKGVEVMLECWEAGSSEPPHSHPGDDMTVVVEGKLVIQFYVKQGGVLRIDGDALTITAGDVRYVQAGRVHDVRYVDACRLVYVHSGAFGFDAAS